MEEDTAAVVVSATGEIGEELRLEALENPGDCVVAEVKTELIDPDSLQVPPQQYIIVTPHETGTVS